MAESLSVLLDDAIVGTLVRLQGGKLRFDYSDEYDTGSARPRCLCQCQSRFDRIPTTSSVHGCGGFFPTATPSWPGGLGISTCRRRPSPFSALRSARTALVRVRFAPPEEIDRVLARPGGVLWLSEHDVAQRLRELRKDSTAWLGRVLHRPVQPRRSPGKDRTALRMGAGSAVRLHPTTHILKPAVAGFDRSRSERASLPRRRRRAGLVAVRTRVAHFSDESAVVVHRYDRIALGGQIARVHQEDLCQALGMPPSRKYQNEGGPGPAEIGKLLRRAMPPQVGDETVGRFADALIWNWLIAGTDAHAKNYSLLLADNQVRLAPLYDIASALPYGTREKKLRFAMKIGGDYRVLPYRNPWPDAARDLGLDAAALVARVRELASLAPDVFADAAEAPEVRELDRPLSGRLVDLVSARAARCLRLIESTSVVD